MICGEGGGRGGARPGVVEGSVAQGFTVSSGGLWGIRDVRRTDSVSLKLKRPASTRHRHAEGSFFPQTEPERCANRDLFEAHDPLFFLLLLCLSFFRLRTRRTVSETWPCRCSSFRDVLCRYSPATRLAVSLPSPHCSPEKQNKTAPTSAWEIETALDQLIPPINFPQ